MTYRANVEEAAAAQVRGEDANWRLAQLTYENTYSAGSRRDQPDRVSMEQWCADVRAASGRDFKEGTGTTYKRIWSIRLSSSEVDWNWSEVYLQAMGETPESNADRRGITEARHARPAIKAQMLQELVADPEISPEVQQAAFQTLAATPAVAEGYADVSSPTAQAVGELHRKAQGVHERRHQERLRVDPVEKRFDESYAALDVEQACRRFATETEKFVQAIVALTPRLGQAGADDRYWITQSVERARTALDQLEVFATTGKSDLDGFLEETLGKR